MLRLFYVAFISFLLILPSTFLIYNSMKTLPIIFPCIILLFFLNSCQRTEETVQIKEVKEGDSVTSKEEVLLYISSRGSGFDIYQNAPLGQNESHFTSSLGWEWSPKWIPSDNIVMINTQDTSGNFSIKAVDLEGNYADLSILRLEEYYISSDGSKFTFSISVDGYSNVFIGETNSPADTINVTPMQCYNGRPIWSPQGDKIAFISNRDSTNEIYIYNITDESSTRITNNEMREKYITWSADGKRLATTMQENTDSPNDIYLIDIATLEVTQVTDTPVNESEIAWSPQSNLIAYHAKVDGKDDIFVLNIATNEVTKITNGEGYHGEPAWVLR